MFFPKRSCEWLDLVKVRAASSAKIRYELREEPGSAANCWLKLKSMQHFKYLCRDAYNDHLKVTSRVVTKGDKGRVMHPMVKVLPANRFFHRHVVRSTDSF